MSPNHKRSAVQESRVVKAKIPRSSPHIENVRQQPSPTGSSSSTPPATVTPSSNVKRWPTIAETTSEEAPEDEALKPQTQESKAQQPTSPQFIGVYEIVKKLDDEPEAFIVRHVLDRVYALARIISVEQFLHYQSIFARLCDSSVQSKTTDETKTLEKIWPRGMELFRAEDKKCYHIAPRHYGTLHTYVIDKKKVNERAAKRYYKQILRMVAFCHDRGIVVRDVKLRKFVFVDEGKKRLRLDDLDELLVCESIDNDRMSDRHGCPAYVSPEILDLSSPDYGGKAADVWGLGVLLYVLLMGRYPFYDTTPSGLFSKIRSAKFILNEQCGVSFQLRMLIRCLLRKTANERPRVREVLAHPWLRGSRRKLRLFDDSTDDEDDTDEVCTEDKHLTKAGISSKLNSTSKTEDPVSDQVVPFMESDKPSIITTTSSKTSNVESGDQVVESC